MQTWLPTAIRRWSAIALMCALPLIVLAATWPGMAHGTFAAGDPSALLTAGLYGVTVVPTASVQLSEPGRSVVHTLRVTNTGALTDSFDLSVSGSRWPTDVLVYQEGSGSWGTVMLPQLPPSHGQTIQIVVHIPRTVRVGESDVATFTVASQGNRAYSATAILTTTATPYQVYLPAALNDWPPSWKLGGMADQTVYQISLCASNPNRLYAGTIANGVHSSVNAGQSWSPTTLSGTLLVRGVAVNPQNCDEAYAAVWGDGVYRTTDGGNQWNRMLILSATYAVAMDPRPDHAQTVYVGTQFVGVYSSTNGGANWSATALTDAVVPALTVATDGSVYVAAWGRGVYRLHEDSVTPLGILPGNASNVFAVAVDPASTDTLYAATEGGLYRSSDGGSSWNLALPGKVYSAAVDPANSQVVYAGVDGGGVWRSQDGGQSFSAFGDGMTPKLSVRSIVMDPATSGYIHAGTTGGAWRFPRRTNGIDQSPKSLYHSPR